MKKSLTALVLIMSLGFSACTTGVSTGKAIKLGGEWFLNNQDENFLHYEYFPFEKGHSDVHHSLREMGALWAVSKLYDFTGDKKYLDLAEIGFLYFEEHFKVDKLNDFYYVNITPDKIKLGYNAFMILTLLEIEHPRKEFYLEKFANGIMYQQKDSGEFATFFYSYRETGVDYYPGEALLALMALYEETGNEEYLASAIKAFPFYREYFRSNPNTAFPPWQMQANLKLYKATESEDVLNFILEMAEYMIGVYSDNCANFDFENSGSVLGVHMEGMNSAYEAAKARGDNEFQGCIESFIALGADEIKGLQFRKNNDFGFEDFEKEAVGGFLGSENSSSMRVDRNQHGVMALIGAKALGLI